MEHALTREGSRKRIGSVLVRGLGGRHDGSRVGNGRCIGDRLTGSAGGGRFADRSRLAGLLVAAELESLETGEQAALLGRRTGRRARLADGSRWRTRLGARRCTHRRRSTGALLLVASFGVAGKDQRPNQSA